LTRIATFPRSPQAQATPLVHAVELGRRLGFEHLYLKLEGANPTGTVKDRIAERLAYEAHRHSHPGLTVGTCGNLGVAFALACRVHGLRCQVFVPARYRSTRRDEMLALGAGVHDVPGTYEDAVEASCQFAHRMAWFDGNPVGGAGRRALRVYGALAAEILEACPRQPASVWISGGNGTAAAGIFAGCSRRGRSPAICVVGSAGNTALTASIAAGRVVELDPRSLRETPANEPLVNWRSLHAAEALAAVVSSGGCSYEATDAELDQMHDLLLEEEGIAALPAAAGALAGLAAMAHACLDRRALHVVVLTA
jgi:threonine synthase